MVTDTSYNKPEKINIPPYALFKIYDKWELIAIKNQQSQYPMLIENEREIFNKSHRLVYKRRNNITSFPSNICMKSFFNLFFENMMHNYSNLFSNINKIPPLSLVTYFSNTPPPANKTFFEFRIGDLGTYDYETYPLMDDRWRSLPCIVPILKRTAESKKYNDEARINNQEIIAYLINSFRRMFNHSYYDCAFMIIEPGTWLSEKEKKKKIIFFSSLGLL